MVLGASVAALALAAGLGIGVEPMPGWTPLLCVIAVAALLPAVAAFHEWRVLHRPARLTVGERELTITYPGLLRAPLSVRRETIRVARVGDVSAVFVGGYTAVPRLVPDDTASNVVLLFETPVDAADVRRAPLGAIYRGERPAGVVLSVADLGAAERALDPWIRQITPYDEYLLEENLDAGGRTARERTRALVWLAVGLISALWLIARVAAWVF
jgi:hypothetical protein